MAVGPVTNPGRGRKDFTLMNMRIVAVFLACTLVVPAFASAQPARLLGVAVAAAGAVMLTIEAQQPVQPMQPGIVSGETLLQETSDFLDSELFLQQTADAASALFGDRLGYACLSVDACVIGVGFGMFAGGFAGAAGALTIAQRGDRTVYAGPFQPFIPYKERSAGLKYGGAAMVIGGAALAALWPNQPAFRNMSVSPLPGGGVRASKTFGF